VLLQARGKGNKNNLRGVRTGRRKERMAQKSNVSRKNGVPMRTIWLQNTNAFMEIRENA